MDSIIIGVSDRTVNLLKENMFDCTIPWP